MNKRFG